MPQTNASKRKTALRSKPAKSAAGTIIVNAVSNGHVSASTVRFGSVVVKATSPKAPELRRNVSSGQIALARATPKIVKAGVSLPNASSVPLYHADPKQPGRVVRDLNGKISTGVFIDGKFKALSKP